MLRLAYTHHTWEGGWEEGRKRREEGREEAMSLCSFFRQLSLLLKDKKAKILLYFLFPLIAYLNAQ